jgi:archaetidylinositol phosphate synthase
LNKSLARSRKAKVGYEILCERVFRPLAHVLVVALLPLRVPPPVVAAASGATGLAAALSLGQGRFLLAAVLVQLKTVLDNADGQLARLSDRITTFGRYLDSELDLLVNAALFAALAWSTSRPVLAAAGFVALTLVLGVNFNLERLFRTERGEALEPMPDATGRADGFLRAVYLLAYAPQDRFVERLVAHRLREANPEERLAYHDHLTVTLVANLGMSTQLAALSACLAAGRPESFAWIALGELAFVGALFARRELLAKRARAGGWRGARPARDRASSARPSSPPPAPPAADPGARPLARRAR